MIEDHLYFYYFNGAPSDEDIKEIEENFELEKGLDEDVSDCFCVTIGEQIDYEHNVL